MVLSVSASDFRLTFSTSEFIWGDETRVGFPLLQMPDGSLCEPVTAYFGHLLNHSKICAGTMRDEAYALRDWFSWLLSRGINWDEPSDELMRQWRQESLVAREIASKTSPSRWNDDNARNKPASTAKKTEPRLPGVTRVERKLACVFKFYRLLPQSRYVYNTDRPFREFVGTNTGGKTCPITSETFLDKRRGEITRWAGRRNVLESARRPTPSAEEVRRVLDTLRGKGVAEPSKRPTFGALDQEELERDRNWLMGACMAAAGLRVAEVAGLPLDTLLEALQNVKDNNGRKGYLTREWPDPPAGCHPLDHIANHANLRSRLRRELDVLLRNNRRRLFFDVIGKGEKIRSVPMPIDVFWNILEIGIWQVRRAQISEWAKRNPDYRASPTVFLSFKTMGPMNPASIGDIAKAAFISAEVDGSAHRLRAYFATMTAIRLIDDAAINNGFRPTGDDKWVTEQLAEILGHSNTSTAVKYYIEIAEQDILRKSKREWFDERSALWEDFREFAPLLSRERLNMIHDLMQALARQKKGVGTLDILLEKIISDPSIVKPSCS